MTESLNVRHYRDELRTILGSPVLRVFFWRLIADECLVFQSGFSLNASAYALLAKQEIGKRLLEDAKQINPDAVYLAEKEYGALRRRSIELDMNQKMEEDIYG